MASLHQLRCFLAAHRLGSFTAAAAELGLSQPSVSEQVRLLERHLRTALFVRAGRGLTPTEAGTTFAPYAERALGVVSDGLAAVRSVRDLESGTVRLGVFGTARTYFGGDLAADILARYPNVRIELIGQNSTEVVSMVRAGQLEAGLVTLPVDDEQLTVAPVARDENVYVSAEPPAGPVSTEQLLRARLVLAQATWGPADSTRRQLIERAQAIGAHLLPAIDVEDDETALELAARGLADAVTPRGLLRRLAPQFPALRWVSLRPRLWERFAVVQRAGHQPSPSTRVGLELAVARLRAAVGDGHDGPGPSGR